MTKIDKRTQAQQAASVKKTQEQVKTQKAAQKKVVKTKSNTSQQAINNVAQGLYDAARKYSGAVGKEEFTNLLKKINKDNVVGVINRYNNVLSPDESIVEMILDEYLSDKKDMKEALVGDGMGKNAIKGIFTCLMQRAEEVGVDSKTLSEYKTQFNKVLDSELNGAAFARSSKKLDEIISVVIQSIDNQVKAKATKTQVSEEQASWLERGAINILMDKNSAAVDAFNKYLKNEKASERMADGFSKIWGSKNTKVKVREDIEANNQQLKELKEAAKKGDAAFRAKFQEIFGVAFNPTNIRAYQDAQKMYREAAKAKSDEDSFKSAFSNVLKSDKLQEEGTYESASTTGATHYRVLATKDQVFKREFNNMAKMFDSVVKADAENFKQQGIESGKDFLNKKFELANAKTDDEKYAVLSSLAKQISSGLEAATQKACGGRSFDAVQKQYDNSYKAAYGLNNDIQKRVNDYVDSQIKGGGYVKMIGTMAIVMSVSALTAGMGTGAAAGAAATTGGSAAASSAAVGAATFAGTKFVIDVADSFSTPELREVLKNEGVKAFFEKGSKQTDWKGITVGALQGGAMCLMFAGQSYAVTNLVARAGQAMGASATATGYAAAGANALGITALGLGTEYLLTGEISVEGAIFTVVMAVTTAGIQVMQVNKAAAQSKAQAEAALNEQIQNARHTMGFEDGVEITPEGLKAQFRKLSIQYHPDKGGTEAQMAMINDAYNTLTTNIGKINQAAVAKAASNPVPQPAEPLVQAAPETAVNPSGVTGLAVQNDAIVIPMPQAQGITGMAASIGQHPVGMQTAALSAMSEAAPKTPATSSMQTIISAAETKAVATENFDGGGLATYSRALDADGNVVKTTVKNGFIERNTYIDGEKNVAQTVVDGEVVGSYVFDGETEVYLDAKGNVITEDALQTATDTAIKEATQKHYAQQAKPQTPTLIPEQQAAVDAVTNFKARYDAGEFPNPKGTATQEQVQDLVKPFEGGEKYTKELAEIKTLTEQGNFEAAVQKSKALVARDAVDQYLHLKEYGKDAQAKEALNNAVEKAGEDALMKAAQSRAGSLMSVADIRIANDLTNAVLVATGKKPASNLPDEFVSVRDEISRLESELENLSAPTKEAVEQIEQQISVLRGKAQARITELQEELKTYPSVLDGYDQIGYDRIQAQIKALREIAPLDRTNLDEVLKASPEEVFRPTKADNIKGQGISFKPVVPTDPEALASVTYRAVPVFSEARTVEEMVRLAGNNGIKIEFPQDANGNYYPAVKAIWSQDGWFALDREGFVVEYGEIEVEPNKDYLDMNWVEKNKYQNAEGKWVVKDCAIVAADKKTSADIMPNSYVKSDGTPITRSDKYDWDGFQAHKDPNGKVNAVAYDSPQDLTTLEGTINTDVTMGDVEGNVYNKYNDLKKQILKNKIQADPEDPNSQAFIDLVKAGKDDEAIALLREATNASQTSAAPQAPAVDPVPALTNPSAAELKLPAEPTGTQSDIVVGWADFVKNAKAIINGAQSIDELRTLRTQIKNVSHKQAAQDLREAYVQKEQELRAALPQEVKDIENMYRPDTSPSAAARERILAKAGFSEGVIDDIIANINEKSPYGIKGSAKMMDEVKNMVIWMEGEIENGATLNRSLIESAIRRFAPDASGASAAMERSILANYWNRGAEVHNAYGLKAPDQSTFSLGNLKAKWNKFKNSVKDYYEYKKWEYGYEKEKVDAPTYENVPTETLMDEFNARFNYGIKDGLTDLRAALVSRGYAPNENGYFLTSEIAPADAAARPSAPAQAPVTPETTPVRAEFVQKFEAVRSTQDLEAMVKMAESPEECEYIISKLDNPNTKAVNQPAIEDIIEYAKFRANSLRVGSYLAQQSAAAETVSPMMADTGIRPLGEISFEEAMPQIQQYAKENGLTISNHEGLFGDTYDLTNAQGQKVRTVVFDRNTHKVDIEWNRTFNSDGRRINETMYDANGKVIESTDFKYANGKPIASIKVKRGYDEVGVWEYSSNGRVKSDTFMSAEVAEIKYGPISHTEILKPAESPAPAAPAKPVAQNPTSLGDSLENPLFPTKFDEAAFKAWADKNGFTMEIKDGIATFRDKDGNLVRRITNDWEHDGQVYDDHVILYDNGEEVAKFIKYADEENVRFYYNTDGNRYASRAELAPDGQWYDYYGNKMRSNPVTGEPQAPAAEPDKQPYTKPEMTEAGVKPEGDVLASDGATSTGFWSTVKRAFGFGETKTLDSALESARKAGAEVKEIAPGEYQVTQRYQMKSGELQVAGANAEKYHIESVATYKDGSPEPVDVIRYFENYLGGQDAVVQRTKRDESGNLTHYILDRGTGYGVEYSGYDAKGNKVPGQEQMIRIIDKNNNVLQTYTGEEIENALLAPATNETSRHSQSLLDVRSAVSDHGAGRRIVEWQADGGTKALVSNGKRFVPENFVRPVAADAVQEYTEFSSSTPEFSAKMSEYNEFARTRNLTISEEKVLHGTLLQFKDAKGHVVRSIKSDGTAVKEETFYELNRDGDVVQSATKDADGNILSRTIIEYRPWWGKASTVTLDYVNGTAESGLYLNGNLTQQKTHDLSTGKSLFRDVAGR